MSMLQANHPEPAAPETGPWPAARRRLSLIACMVLVVLVIVACADDSDNRQFANEPVTPHPTATATIGTPETVQPVAPGAPLASPEVLVDRRGAPSIIYALVDGHLWSFDGSSAREVTTERVLAFAASPSGNQVAIVTASENGSTATYDITVLEPNGNVDQEFEDVLRVEHDAATPEASLPQTDAVHLSWAPQGRRVLLAHASGRLIDIPFDGQVREIKTRTTLDGLIQAAWSPRGDLLGVVRRDRDGDGLLALIDPTQYPARVNVIAPVEGTSGGGISVEAFAWRPSGEGVLFLQGERRDHEIVNAQLLRWDREANTLRVVATGGQGGPTGSITSFTIAPDGKAVAYTISFRTNAGWAFSGLYVRSMREGQVYGVPVPADATVTDVRWMRDGLAWGMVVGTHDTGDVTFQRVDGAGQLVSLGTVGSVAPSTPSASPVAATPSTSPIPERPVASPAASPVGASPISETSSASPIATPATPIE
jgi:hypothetical protein